MREMLMFNCHWIPSWLLPTMGSHMSLSNLLPILPSSSFTAPHAVHSIAVNTWSAMYKVVQRQWYWPWTRSFLCLSSLASLKGNFHTQFPMQWKNNMTTKVESSNSCGTWCQMTHASMGTAEKLKIQWQRDGWPAMVSQSTRLLWR